MTNKEKIQKLIEERQKYLDILESSWDKDKGTFGEYTMEEPDEIHDLAESIRKSIQEGVEELECDFILESLTMLGDAPQLVYDDNGHWAVSGNGFSSIPISESGKFEGQESMTTIVEPDEWKDTIREAIKEYVYG